MTGVVIAIVVIVAAIVIWLVAARRERPGSDSTGRAVEPADETIRPRPRVRDFHVRGSEALVYFDVPVQADVDPVLADLLGREAVEVLREKRSHDLPIDQVTTVKAFGRLNGADHEVSSVTLEAPGELPPIDHVPAVPHLATAGFDPLKDLGGGDHGPPPGVDMRTEDKALGPVGSDVRLTGALDAGLRAQGIDPRAASAGDLVLGLLRLTGYSVMDKGDGTYEASKPGARTFVRVVPHTTGDYPELDEKSIRKFLVDFGGSGNSQGLLVTDKYGPFSVYETERRDKRVHFLTRERIQSFVDGFAVS